VHEARLVRDLVDKVVEIAAEEGAARVDAVVLEVDPRSHLTAESVRGQFAVMALDSVAENARIDVQSAGEGDGPLVFDVRIVSITVGT
jgi:Zn finger protein HypA/HybF involved in hydrogenase expression